MLVVAGVASVVVAATLLSPVCACGSPSFQSRLSADGPSVAEIVETVRRHARSTPGAQPDAPVDVVFTTKLPVTTGQGQALFGGLHLGDTAYVRMDVAWPERTLVHEVAHLLTRGDDHGPVWQAVYLGAIGELYGEIRSSQEERRIGWVYERCYLTDDCPVRADRAN